MAETTSPRNRPVGPMEQKKLDPLPVRLERLGLLSDWDFAFHLPLRYEDETSITPIGEIVPDTGIPVQCQGTVQRAGFRATSRGQIYVAEVADETGMLALSFFHYYKSITSQVRYGEVVRVFGAARRSAYDEARLEMIHPKIRKPLFDAADLPKTLTPVYPAGEGLQQNWLRKRIQRALLDLNVQDIVPEEVTEKLGLPRLGAALRYLHNPPADAGVSSLQDRTAPAWLRLKFDELLAQQIALAESRRKRAESLAPSLRRSASQRGDALIERFVAGLPFSLTRAQSRVWKEIEDDLQKTVPMHRLVQGDVGSGKTVVAALTLLRAVECDFQGALMAPTELLAEQHYRKLVDWFTPLGLVVVRLSGSQRTSEKREALEALRSGRAHIAVGTHALIQEGVEFAKLGVCVIDEQHRFGVEQRLQLRNRSVEGAEPHLLLMSATPIPRTLAMSYLADLSVSAIDELPPGRTPVDTRAMSLAREEEVVQFLARAVAEERQVYWVCPLVEESEKLDLTAATDRYEALRARLPGVPMGLLHGRMTPEEKEAAMRDFLAGRTRILVATTVIEVGVDVPNASIMVIEHAERFGLAQLHQLRGRVGRGAAKSFCLLLYDPAVSDEGRQRLAVIRSTHDGFEVARHDLRLRGPGEFLGEKQSGVPILRFADLGKDEALLVSARDWATRWLEEDREAALSHARRWFKTKADYLGI